jgi:outer membrane protein
MRRQAALLAGAGFLMVLGQTPIEPVRAQSPTATAGAKLQPPTARPPRATRPTVNGAPLGVPHTLQEALAATYSYQPALQAARARLRATDEGIPQALSGWRPTVVLNGGTGYGDGLVRQYLSSGGAIDPVTGRPKGGWVKTQTDRLIGQAQAVVTQPIYNGGKTPASVNKAKNTDMAERASLIAQEQASFANAVSAYVGVIQQQQILALNVNNVAVLKKQLEATNDRYRVGEITRTDVAQAQAALAGGQAQLEVAKGQLQTAKATYLQVIGFPAPDDLVEPQPLKVPVATDKQAADQAANNNPTVIAALFNNAAAKDNIDIAISQLLPQLNVTGQVFQQNNLSGRNNYTNGYEILANLSVPLYQGGQEYSAVRQARQQQQQAHDAVNDARRTAIQTAVSAWDTLVAAKASAQSTREQIRANQVALEGVEREAIVGSRTTLDVLNAQQALLQSETNLVQALAQLVIASYNVASAIGRLTARDLSLPVPLYDDMAYYNAVKNKWFGLGDYATDQPGR